MLPPEPSLERAVVPGGEAAIRVEFDREVTLNRDDAAGFDLGYDVDEDNLPTLTGRARTDGGTVVLESEEPIDLPAEPYLDYEPDDEGPNVLGTEDGVAAGAFTVRVVEGEGASDGSGNTGGSDGSSGGAENDQGVPTLVEADVTETEPDHIVCTFDEAVEEDAAAFTIEGAETRVVGTVDTGGPRELTLELIDPVPEGETVKVVYAPGA
jgi:hypothetical protein